MHQMLFATFLLMTPFLTAQESNQPHADVLFPFVKNYSGFDTLRPCNYVAKTPKLDLDQLGTNLIVEFDHFPKLCDPTLEARENAIRSVVKLKSVRHYIHDCVGSMETDDGNRKYGMHFLKKAIFGLCGL